MVSGRNENGPHPKRFVCGPSCCLAGRSVLTGGSQGVADDPLVVECQRVRAEHVGDWKPSPVSDVECGDGGPSLGQPRSACLVTVGRDLWAGWVAQVADVVPSVRLGVPP